MADNIIIKIVGQDKRILKIKIGKNTPLKRAIAVYCERTASKPKTLRFLFDGDPLNEMDTPGSLEMEEGDTIEVYPRTADYYITLRVLGPDKKVLYFRIGKNTPFKRLFNVYCQRLGIEPHFVRFLYDGDRINDIHTANGLEMEEGDVIDVFEHQVGGLC